MPTAGTNSTSLRDLASTLTSNANRSLLRLQQFQELSQDSYPRAFQDTSDHLRAIIKSIYPFVDRDADSDDELQRKIEGCLRQVESLDRILDKFVPDGYGKQQGTQQKPGRVNEVNATRLTSKQLRDIYKEKDIPKIQKSLQAYEASMKGSSH